MKTSQPPNFRTHTNRPFVVVVCTILVWSMAILAPTARADLALTFDGGAIPASGEIREFLLNLYENSESVPIYAIDLSLEYDEEVIEIVSVTSALGSTAWGEPAWSTSNGVLRIAHAGSIPITSVTSLFSLGVVAKVNPNGDSTGVDFLSIFLNDGRQPASGFGSSITVNGTPVFVNGVTISPSRGDVLVGQTVRFDVFVDTNGDDSIDWDFGEGFQLGQILPTGVYVAPAVLEESREIVLRASSRIFPEAYAEASLTILPVVGDPRPELWFFTNPANKRLVEIYASTGTNSTATVIINAGVTVLETTPVGSPVFAHRATLHADPTVGSVSITAEIGDVSITRTITF